MKKQIISLAILLGTAAPAMAQSGSIARSCGTREAVGYLGISGIDCNCTIATPGTGKPWAFRTEPKITSLEMDSRAGGLLKVGDVITAVNGKLITTKEGAEELANIEPGESVVLTVRRADQTLKYAITAEGVCPNDTRLFGLYAPGRALGWAPMRPSVAPPVGGVPGELAPTPAPGATPKAWSGSGDASKSFKPAAAGGATYAFTTPRVTFGMGLTCSNCTMAYTKVGPTEWVTRFTKPPEVYSIEKGGPADKAGIRRGDIITHVNGQPIDSDEGGRIFTTAKTGQLVKFTIVRNNASKTYTVKADQRSPAATPAYAASSESLLRARQSLTEMQKAQEEQLRRLREDLARTKAPDEQALRESQRELLREEQIDHQRLTSLSTEMSKAESQLRKALSDSTRSVCPVPLIAPNAPGAARTSRTLRYTATLGDAEIEVRGSSLVSVSETPDEVVITTGGAVVRVKKQK